MQIEDADTGEWENAEKKEKKKKKRVGKSNRNMKADDREKIISGGQAGPLSTMLASWPVVQILQSW